MFTKRIARKTSFDIHEPTSLNGPLNYSPKTVTRGHFNPDPWTRARRHGERDTAWTIIHVLFPPRAAGHAGKKRTRNDKNVAAADQKS